MNIKIFPEYIPNNIIDKNIQDFLKPLNFMFSCFVLSKYKISHNFITPNNFKYHMKSLLGFAAIVLLHTYPFASRNLTNVTLSEFVYWATISILLFRVISFLITYTLNTINGLNNVQLIIKIQQAHQIISMPENVLKKYAIWNWIYVIIKFPFFTLVFVIFIFFMELLNTCKILYVISVMFFDCNIIYACRLMKLIRIEMIYLIKKIEKLSRINSQRKLSRHENINCKKIIQAYLDLLSAFDIFKKLFHFPVSFYFCILIPFLYSCFYLCVTIQLMKKHL